MAELVDALDSGFSGIYPVGVQISLWADRSMLIAIATTVVLSVTIYLLINLRRELEGTRFTLRGVLKYYSSRELPENAMKHTRLLMIALIFLFFSSFALVISLVIESDNNYLAGLYPFVWHYFFMRYLLWEKADLESQH